MYEVRNIILRHNDSGTSILYGIINISSKKSLFSVKYTMYSVLA